MGTATDSWLARIIEQAVENDWCTETICTTCGAHDFRRAVWAEAAVQIGRSFALQRGEWPNRKLFELPDGERQALIDAVVTGLVGLPRDFRRDQAVRTVLNDLGRVIPLSLVEPSLERSEAGEVLRRQRQYEADRVREHRERAESEERIRLEEARASVIRPFVDGNTQ